MINKGLFTSNTDKWATPKAFFTALNAEFHFTCDVCADKTNAKCSNYYTEEDNGLLKEWTGVCYMNPPYGRTISHWVKKAAESKCITVCLLPARTDTKWFHTYIYNKPNTEIRFIEGRLHFNDSKNAAPFPSMIVIFNNK